MKIIGTLVLILVSELVPDFYAKGVFIARAYCRHYGHGKSWKKAHKHYKQSWSIIQRVFWIPVFKEKYERKYKKLAYWSFIHKGTALITILSFIINEFLLVNGFIFWHYVFAVHGAILIYRIIYNDALARGKI